MNLPLVKQIADAVLYEGYILYPYRASAVKNQRRFNFGTLYPRSFSETRQGTDPYLMRTECLIEGSAPIVDVRARFLQLVSREVYTMNGQLVPLLEVDSDVYHTWQEAIEREVVAENLSAQDLIAEPQQSEFAFQACESSEALKDSNGEAVGKLVRRQEVVQGTVEISAQAKGKGLNQLSVEIRNTTPYEPDQETCDAALMHSAASTHTILSARGGGFVSLLEPPESVAEIAAACENIGTWPVLVGEQGVRDMMLSSPIILYDYPQIAPESDGDFFDGTEIDEMLALRVMTLTDEEKREMQHVDDRARQILERTESLRPEHWQKLHGTIRDLKTIDRS